MQMMPFVAYDLAPQLELKNFSKEHLKEPNIALKLGALHLTTLRRQFGDFYLVLAAYNAGPHMVQKWLSHFGHVETALFVERIPYKQTRDYVKKVLTLESLYSALDGNPLKLML
jgi:soluble lytic murein transglycosylase